MEQPKNETKTVVDVKPVIVKLLKRYGPVNPGEIAGYPQKLAESLISRKVAVRV